MLKVSGWTAAILLLYREGRRRAGSRYATGRDGHCQNAVVEYAIQTAADSYAGFLEAARWAERKELAAFAIPDHYLYGTDAAQSPPAYDAFAVMAGLARETATIELVILVSPITFRHPSVITKNVATIQEMAGGRFKLGLGTGWLEQEHTRFGIDFPERGERFARLEEALGYLRAAFAEPPASFCGVYYNLEGFDIQPRPDLRLVVGGTGAVKTPQLAGRYADELNAYPAIPNEYAARIERARSAAVAAARDPASLLISSSGQIVAADTEQGYHELMEEIAAEHGTSADKLEQEAARRNAPRGTWHQVRDIMAGMQDAGMSRFYFQGTFDPDAIELRLEKLM
jgi:alkanesulfonate monooxygenase SsuD/methylene tetrahydromethanopterin reductase-like flavin-dependent oxidoreductase (luciferase family)